MGEWMENEIEKSTGDTEDQVYMYMQRIGVVKVTVPDDGGDTGCGMRAEEAAKDAGDDATRGL